MLAHDREAQLGRRLKEALSEVGRLQTVINKMHGAANERAKQLDGERAAHVVACQERDEGARWRRQGEAELRAEIGRLRTAARLVVETWDAEDHPVPMPNLRRAVDGLRDAPSDDA